jgi:hypothetical protein
VRAIFHNAADSFRDRAGGEKSRNLASNIAEGILREGAQIGEAGFYGARIYAGRHDYIGHFFCESFGR